MGLVFARPHTLAAHCCLDSRLVFFAALPLIHHAELACHVAAGNAARATEQGYPLTGKHGQASCRQGEAAHRDLLLLS